MSLLATSFLLCTSPTHSESASLLPHVGLAPPPRTSSSPAPSLIDSLRPAPHKLARKCLSGTYYARKRAPNKRKKMFYCKQAYIAHLLSFICIAYCVRDYSYSIVATGFFVISYTTLLILVTSLVILSAIFSSKS